MKHAVIRKQPFPVEDARRCLEPGPVVLVTSCWRGRRNVMTMGWHTPMEFSPSLVGCVIASSNHSHAMIRRSRECVLNVPTVALIAAVVGIGTSSGATVDKFARHGLTAQPAAEVGAPLIGECVASFECRLFDAALVRRYDFFVFEIVRAWVAPRPRHPATLHYEGAGVFRVAGRVVRRRQAALL